MRETFGLPNQNKNEQVDNVESLADWRELRDEASEQAKTLLQGISDFENFTPQEQLQTLNELFVELQNDNKNRFIGRVIAEKIAILESAIEKNLANVDAKNERATTPHAIPVDYLGQARMVLPEEKQYLSPANDNRPATPALMRAG